MADASELSLGGEQTYDGAAKPQRADVSLGAERTLGDVLSGQETIIDDIEEVDLDARYRVEGTLGQGGMGSVLLATDTRLDRKVAIKRILGKAAGNRMAVQRFLTEAKSIAALNHPNIVQIYDYGRAKDGPFLIMEFVDGASLLDRCRDEVMPLEDAVDLACQLCDGLAKAHDLGIIHRDIKPANVLLTKDGTLKLTDFGLAKAQAGDHGQTMTGSVLGTPDFMPPEQRRDAALVDHRSDLWSLAATVYQMVTGRSPKVINLRNVPPQLHDVLGKALEDDKNARYESVREFREALKSVTGGAVVSGASVAALTDGELQEGQCKACGTVNTELNRKFCKKCGGALRAACLACATQIPVWDMICGECGGKQPSLLDAKRKNLEAKRADAEALLADLAFDEAIGLANEAASESRVELADLVEWAPAFIATAMAERDRQRSVAAERLDDARVHLAVCDYLAAIQSLKMIPHRLRDGGFFSLLSYCQSKREESEKLLAEIASRCGRKEIDGLLPLVERAVGLLGDRADLTKIRQQLTERIDMRLALARAAIDGGDAKSAAAALAGAVVEDLGPEGGRLLEQVRQAVELENKLASVVRDSKADGVVTSTKAVEIRRVGAACLAVNPRSPNVWSLVEKCDRIINVTRFTNAVGIKMTLIRAGRFTMGDSDDPHEVTLTKPFYMGVYAVTNAQWKRLMGSKQRFSWEAGNCPVRQVSWDDAVEFCKKLSALPEERNAGRAYRLPTEAEWEHACRAGTKTEFSFGDDEKLLGDYGWFDGNSNDKTHPVGQKKPNEWGLYDMHGNVSEWVSCRYGKYAKGEITDPHGPSWGGTRVYRGGSFDSSARDCRSAFRKYGQPSDRCWTTGFRLALSPSELKSSEAEK